MFGAPSRSRAPIPTEREIVKSCALLLCFRPRPSTSSRSCVLNPGSAAYAGFLVPPLHAPFADTPSVCLGKSVSARNLTKKHAVRTAASMSRAPTRVVRQRIR